MHSHKPILFVVPDYAAIEAQALSTITGTIENWKDNAKEKRTEILAGAVDKMLDSCIDDYNLKQITKSQKKLLKQLRKQGLDPLVQAIPRSSISEELEFPPGHPYPGNAYTQHPLKEKNNLYILLESYGEMLYEERESELKNLLIDLGATKITIEESDDATRSGEVELAASLPESGGSGSFESEEKQLTTEADVIVLTGKPYTPELKVERSKYNWLPYEPKWDSLCNAREEGGALSYWIELTTDTSHILSAQMGMDGWLSKILNLEMGFKSSKARCKKRRFTVEFAGAATRQTISSAA